jgi:hypothetical protein
MLELLKIVVVGVGLCIGGVGFGLLLGWLSWRFVDRKW